MSESTATSSLPTFSIDLGSIRSMLEYRFTIKHAYVDIYGFPTFIVSDEPVKQKFQELLLDLRNHHLTARIQRVADDLVVSVFPKPNIGPPRLKINLALFLATVASVAFASYLLIFDVDPRLTSALFPNSNLGVQVVILAILIFSIVGIHEMGHVLTNRHYKMDATLPYFLPAPPPFGTFGAVISLRSPPGNRDQLFDLGFSGPIAGFLATILVAFFVYFSAPLISAQQTQLLLQAKLLSFGNWPNDPLLLEVITGLGLRNVPAGETLILTQFYLAAEFGALITFLNILPIWQLDGGHIARATFGDKGHKLTALIGFGVLILAGREFWPFALLLMAFMLISRRPFQGLEPLDDVSPLSNSRKALFAIVLAMLVLCFFIF